MLAYGAVLAFSLGWLLASGFFGPSLLRRLPAKTHPRLRLALWLGGLYSMVFSTFTALIATAVILAVGWLGSEHISPGRDNIAYVLLISVLPWVGLAVFAAVVALIITRFEPARDAAKQTTELMQRAGTAAGSFQGVPLQLLELPYLAAALVDINRRPTIVLTSAVQEQLAPKELDAVYWHELGHAFGQHNGLNRLARVARTFAPRLPLTRDIADAVEQCCEQLADRFALKRVDAADLTAAKAKFSF